MSMTPESSSRLYKGTFYLSMAFSNRGLGFEKHNPSFTAHTQVYILFNYFSYCTQHFKGTGKIKNHGQIMGGFLP